GPLTPAQVAGYLAKYATKDATTILGDRHTRPHLAAIRATAHQLHARALAAHGLDSPYALLGKWAPMLGFRGHFSTKSRRYSITLGALRRARHRWQALAAQSRRTGTPLDTADLEERLLADDDQETTLVIGSWAYAGTGWRDTTEHALALATAARAREHHQWQAARTHGTHDRRNGRWHEDAEA
ncbi:MAG TPA: replication initiator, partial [Dermatophilaceae bacterium]|nr:replication initiator [Dermatophilaceae bacterium]